MIPRFGAYIASSHTLQHAAQLFIGSISDPYVSADGTLELSIASSRALLNPDELPIATATLIAINWSFAWKSNSTETTFVNPFSSQHLLPIQNMVSSVVERVLSRDFVRRYPLIFGVWRNSIGAEMAMFPQVNQPILNIIARSKNTTFQKQCRRLLRASFVFSSLRRSNNTVYDSSLNRLQDALGSLTLDDVLVLSCRNDERVLLVSLQRLHRTLFRAERFKASTFINKSDDPLHNSDHYEPSSDVLLEYDGSEPFEDLGDPPLDSDENAFMDLFTESESPQDTRNRDIPPFETLGSQETADTGGLSEADADASTLAGLDDHWDSTDLEPNSTQRRELSFLDDDNLGYMTLDLDASSTGFPWHASTRSDISRFYGLDTATLDQPVLDLDSDDEMYEEEAVLNF
ncbi:hypothetical protein BDM02DRAFT_3184620 [Thelephora ganbajun]|uniref:Uncharacterized protein n=1 Tax=Thelephora ganbajun TaxID=370292 RepID=A0ACB6ZPB1_THEGA|nr:hypothetical protein BDM02DRAFT_3184620 [Thelephora ganbajun]